MSLDLKSIHELRGIAQAVGLQVDWGWNKLRLIERINNKIMLPLKPPPKVSDMPKPITGMANTQESVIEALKGFRELVVTFPMDNGWQLNHGKREDSGSMNIPLFEIVKCARALYD